jgi:hypothetical protein
MMESDGHKAVYDSQTNILPLERLQKSDGNGNIKFLTRISPNQIKSLILYHNVVIYRETFEKVSKNCRHNGPQNMNLTKKNLVLLVIFGILVSGIPVITLCSSYCVSSDLDLDSHMDGSCPYSFHSFVQFAMVWPALFVLPLAGLFHARGRQFIPPGVYFPPFKPPRFSH